MKQVLKAIGDFIIVIIATLFGTIAGGAIFWIPGYTLLSLVFPPITDPMRASEECSRGSGLGAMSILIGGLIGGIICFIAIVKNIRRDRDENLTTS